MKRSLLVALLAAGVTAGAQTPRLSLYEEFTGETCPPCAAINPTLNAILASPTNTPKVVAIKWQVPIPSAPTNTWSLYRTNKADIDWRYGASPTNYGYPAQYSPTNTAGNGISSAPTGLFDGQHAWNFGAASDHPYYVSNAVISTAQSYTSAFSVSLTNAWDATFSAQTVTVSIMATANFSATGTLMFRTVMVEKHVHFPVQSGTNGEKDFDDVAIAAFPSVQGMTISPTWTVGQTQSFTLNCPLPSYTRDKAQVAFVGFIQDDGNRKVAQAVRANPILISNDAKAVSLTLPAPSCAAAFTPTFVVNNTGGNAITDLTITPYVDGVALTNYTWSGNLAVGATTNLVGNSITPGTSGGHTFSINITGVSGGDNNTLNNTASSSFYLVTGYQGTPVAEAFSVVAYPPAGWGLVNTNGGATWTRNTTANGPSMTSGTGASKYDFYSNNVTGDADELLMPPIDLSGNSTPTLAFDVAYAQYTTENDQLDVFVSTDCGANWQNVYSKSGSVLSTANAMTGAFTPTTGSQWRKEKVALTGLNANSVLVKFVATSAYGNNLYIDNVNLAKSNTVSTVGIIENAYFSNVELFPNPASNVTELKIESFNNTTAVVKISNSIGQLVIQKQVDLSVGVNSVSIDVKDLPSGIYSMVIDSNNTAITKKLTVNK